MGRTLDILAMALTTVWAQKLRSGLTILGVTIGTTCVIAIGSILTGMDRSVVRHLEGFGTDSLFIFKWKPGIRTKTPSREERTRKPLSWEDYEALRDGCDECRQVSPVQLAFGIDVARYRGEEFSNVEFRGGLPSFPDALNMPVALGRFFSEAEDQHRAPVCVVGADVVKTLMPHEHPLGKTIVANGHPLTIIGVFERRKAGNAFGDSSMDRYIIVPLSTFKKRHPRETEMLIVVRARPGRMKAAIEQVRTLLRKSRRVGPGGPDTFGMDTVTSMIKTFRQITGAVALVLVVISSMGLLVGGVGVMNIMLVSVTERTREIGMRRTVGARRRDIVLQFLFEAATLTGAGGALGIATGLGLSAAIGKVAPSIPSAVPLWAVVLGLGVSVGLGLFFGIWPAVRAARLDPVEALRHE